jgi:hypothetical protein
MAEACTRMQLLLAKVGEGGRSSKEGWFTILAAIGSFGARYHFYPLNRDFTTRILGGGGEYVLVSFWADTHKPQPSEFE